MKGKKFVVISLVAVLTVALAVLCTGFMKNVQNKFTNIDAEILRSQNYEQITDDNSKIDGTEYVKFSSFFTRDLNNDGVAEKLLGTCRNVNSTDVLYMDLNVVTNGYLKDGKITIKGTNFNYSMNMVKDKVLKNNYISDDVKVIELNQVNSGTQKLIIGDVVANIGNDINNYSKVSSVTLEGTHVADDGVTKTPIKKTIDLTVDWHGSTRAELYTGYQATTFYYNYDQLDTETISFNFRLDELQEELILKENVATVTIPELNGYAPTEVMCTNDNIESEYNEGTKTLKIRRTSIVNEKGVVTSTLSRSNTYTINVTYPKEAYESISSYTTINIPITGYYIGYNNQNEEFKNENPYKSNEVNGNITIIFRETPKGNIYNFYVNIQNKQRIKKVSYGGEQAGYKYVISKQDILNLYDNYTEESNAEIENKEYVVRWQAVRGTEGTVPSMIMSETKGNNGEIYGDKWNTEIIEKYAINTGIYFEGADQFLKEDGTISVYNNDTGELIYIFTKDEWNKYTKQNPFKYETPIRHIRVETSKTNINSDLNVYNIKEIEVSKVIQDFTKEEIKDIELMYTYLTGVCNIEGQEAEIREDWDSVCFISEKSNTSIDVTEQTVSTQEILYSQIIEIKAECKQEGDSKWKNGEFLVELPEEIINLEIREIYTENKNLNIVAYDVYEEEGKYFIKIITKNETPESFTIKICCNMTPNPTAPTANRHIKLYSYNELCNEYYYETADEYDVNSNNNKQEMVGNCTTKLNFTAPTSLITVETITDYDNMQEGEITIAPNVAEVEKETRRATINISLTNNYKNTVSGVQVLGKIPFKGNTYILNKNELASEYTTTITNEGIKIPAELQGKVSVYYSEKENPTKDLLNAENGWTLKESVQDFSKIKTYLIDFNQDTIQVGKSYSFSYVVNIPENLKYNSISYSNHAVYYELQTDGGKLQLSTEPNKVGLKIVGRYTLELMKHKKGFENLKIPGATYIVETADTEDEKNYTSRILTTNSNGNVSMKNLYIGVKYIVEELKSPENYILNDEVIEFKVEENEQGLLYLETASDKITLDSEKQKIYIKTYDEPKYNVTITKTDSKTGELLSNVYFTLNDKPYMTDKIGQVTMQRLELNTEYKLKEVKADGYYLPNGIVFRLIENENGNLQFETNSEEFKNAIIENNEESDLIKTNISLTNEKIPTYNLQILKVEEESGQEDITKLKPLPEATFSLEFTDLIREQTFTTKNSENESEKGIINVPNLYQYVEGKYITGKYILQEIQAPQGYANNAERIEFRVVKNNEDKLEVQIENRENLTSIRDIQIEEGTVKIIIQDKPLFKLTKTDKKTGKPLANAQFVIYEIDSNGSDIDYAKDVNNEYVGKENKYVVTTDETGTITLPLRGGLYRIVEVGYPEGYQENEIEQYFEIAGGKEKILDEPKEPDNTNEEQVFEIDTIEKLVEFSKNVNEGNSYSGTTVKLMKTLDFTDKDSYESQDSYEILKPQLTEGEGFIPIGSSDKPFNGIFDGQENEIRNLFIKGTGEGDSRHSSRGLFGYISGAQVKNLKITGEIDVKERYSSVGGIVGYAEESNIINCCNSANIDNRINGFSSGNETGGIVGVMRHGVIKNCYNTGKIIAGAPTGGFIYIGGIVGYIEGNSIEECYNIGDINVTDFGQCVGGIAGRMNFSKLRNLYNAGKICFNGNILNYNGAYGGIVGDVGFYDEQYSIDNCYNIGDIINATERSSRAGTIIGMDSETRETNCYYLDSINVIGVERIDKGTPISKEYMKSKEFFNALNVDNVWIYRKGSYPKLNTGIPLKIEQQTSIDIKNELKKFNITTEVGLNADNERTGGSITGEYTGAYLGRNHIKFVETIDYNCDSKEDIIINPDNDYVIKEIRINEEILDITVNEDGSYTIPKGYFKEVKQDYHIVVIFARVSETLILNKVDSSNNTKLLPGAKFKIEQIEDRPQVTNEVGSLTNNGTNYFTNNSGKYISNNNEKNNTTANSYIPIDLTNKKGKYTLTVNAEISSEENFDIGYAIITKNTTVPSMYTEAGRFIYISGTQLAKDYTTILEAGYKYYLHLGYLKNGSNSVGNDTFTINSVRLSLNTDDFYTGEHITNANGQIIENVPLGKYKITELEAPEGYALHSTTREVTLSTGNCNITIENKKVKPFEITKVDKETNKPIENVKFAIYSITEDYQVQDFIKDRFGNYIGNRNEDGIYEISTDANGQILLHLAPGLYEAVEISAPEGYVLEESESARTTYFKVEESQVNSNTEENNTETNSAEENSTDVNNADFVIDTIEKLVEFSNLVNSGENNFEGKTVVLANDLDFKNPDDYTSYPDYNGEQTPEGIMAELTSGSGFKPIGANSGVPFKGTFNGNNKKIKNLYINYSGEGIGLFGCVNNAKICNLGITGEGKIKSGGSSGTGTIAGVIINSTVENCYNSIDVIGSSMGIGGIVGEAREDNNKIINCYNEGAITSTSCSGNAGIIGYVSKKIVIDNCYNMGAINGSGGSLGGIVGFSASDSIISNCHNEGTISDSGSSQSLGGIIGYNLTNSKIINCYNKGAVIASGSALTGGIVGSDVTDSKIINTNNTGNITSNSPSGGIGFSISNSKIINSYNTGNIKASAPTGGIAYSISNNSKVINCYNRGNVEVNGAPASGLAYSISNSEVNNFYNVGTISSSISISGGITYSSSTNNIINNCYYLNSSAEKGIYNQEDIQVEAKTHEEMQSEQFVKLLNTNKNSVNSETILFGWEYNNDSYPTLDKEHFKKGRELLITNVKERENFILTKKDKITDEVMPEVKFMVLDEQGNYAKDYFGTIIGEKEEINGQEKYLVTTDKNGQVKLKLNIGKYKLVEVKTLEGYILGIEQEFEITSENEDIPINITVTNQKAAKVIVHHLLEGTGPEHKDENGVEIPAVVLAEDELLEGKVPDEYTTAPNMKIEGYTLIRGEDGEYVIPVNASGEYAEEEQHVYYYYRKANLRLTVHHYLEGTENKVPLGKNEQKEDIVAEDEISYHNEGDHYTTVPSNDVLKAYELVGVVGDKEKDITQDEVVTYYYKIKKHKITTRVEIPEEAPNYGRTEKGGSISGEDLTPYETVEYGKTSKEDIVVKPEDGYRIKQIRLVSTNEEEVKTESIIYINGKTSEKEETENAEITYKANVDGSLTLTIFENMKEDKEVIVVFEPDEGKLIVHHYIEGTTEKIYDDQVTIDLIGKEVETSPVRKENYIVVGEPEDRVGTITKQIQEKTYYYQRQYKVTTDIIKYEEPNEKGEMEEVIDIGTIDGKGETSYEDILKGRTNQKAIAIAPKDRFQITKITINGEEFDYSELLKEDGSVTLQKEFFKNIDEDKHIEVEFRRKTKVHVKYLEVGTKNILEGEEIIEGYVGKDFETERKNVPNYKTAKVGSETGITNEIEESIEPNGQMTKDEITIIYWYEKIQAKVIAHYYLKETGPEYENEAVVLAKDETIPGTVNGKYITIPNMDIKGYTLIKDENGEYILPENKTGIFTEKDIHVYYYYTKDAFELIVHHYLEGTTEKLDDDEHYYYDEGTHYKTKLSEVALKAHELVEVVGDEEKDITKNEKVIYYYRIKKHEITTRVEIPKKELEAGRTEKGGTISGENESPYETIDYGKASKEDIVITPNKGYRIREIRLVSTSEENINKESIIYINGDELEKEETENAEITYTYNLDGSLILTKFENMTEDKEVIVVFEPVIGKVIVHHYIEGTTEEIIEDEITQDLVGTEVKTKPVTKENYIVVQEPEDKNTAITEGTQEKTYYYQIQYKITTDIVKYEEPNAEGKIEEVINIGTIDGKGEKSYEDILKGRANQKTIAIAPKDGFQITKITINGTEFDYSKLLKEDGSVTLPKEFFKDVDENKHVEVEFRRKTKVHVKYLEAETKKELEAEELIEGYVGKDFETQRKNVQNYKTAKVGSKEGITNEKEEVIKPNGKMTKDEITIIYWYEKIPSGVIVKHIEKVTEKTINEETGKEEIKVTGVLIDEEEIPGYVGESKNTERRKLEGKYESYIPAENKDVKEGINVGKEESSKTITFKENEVIEVIYWYEKEFKITTDIIEHKETTVNPETGKEETTKEKGGEISGEDETPYEKVIRSNDSTKGIKIAPNKGYRIKQILINNKEIIVDQKIEEGGSITLKAENGYFTNMQEDKKILVEFEKIPAKVIVKYKDSYTKESIAKDKIITGYVNDKYNETRLDIKNYITAESEPENTAGIMTEETITITYWYTKEFKITTDVKEHEEKAVNSETGKEENVKVKGGSITGEDAESYEIVIRGETSTKEIIIKPENAYRIKTLTINGKEIEIKDLVKEDNTIELPFFEKMQEDKHIVVEFEKIPAKVTIKYLEEGTEKPIYKTEDGKEYEEIKGYINDKYETKEKEIEYYELVKEKYPKNSNGSITEEEIEVKYYYKKLLFNMKIEKEIEKIILNGQNVEVTDKNKQKLEIKYKELKETKLEITYKIKVKNTEKVEGIAIIEEMLPEGFEFVNDEDSIWREKDGKYTLTTEVINPGETKEYEITLKWNPEEANTGEKVNTAKIENTVNIPEYKEITQEDNEDTAKIEIKLERTIEDIINDIKEDVVNMPKTGQARIVYIVTILVAGTCISIMVWRKRKEIRDNDTNKKPKINERKIKTK